jgi:NAD(P)-dependent dehydrogenase (short-subunit alcohol dehydrogenase family)
MSTVAPHFVLVGGSRGLGLVLARAAAERGAAVSVLSRTPGELPNARHYPCDITQPQESRAALHTARSEQGEFNGLVFFQRFRGTSDEWEGELKTSLTAVREIIEEATPLFAPDGSVVLVSSPNGTFISPHLPCGYHIAKAGLIQLARYYACRLGPRGIRVNAVCPSTFL